MNARTELPLEQDPANAAPLAPGEVVAGKYRILETAGQGGMAIVYAAHHLVLDQRVAVKVLVAQGARDEVPTERFVREAQAAARLQSEHAVRVMDAGVLATGQPYLVMEYLEGCDLAELLGLSGPIEIPELVDYMLQALEGIAHAHAASIVHRDVKPSNLFITVRPDGSNTIKVLDFGISKSTVEQVDPEAMKLTGNIVLGSPAYMSPEQVRNASGVDGRSDVWSLGVSMYELLTGRMPSKRTTSPSTSFAPTSRASSRTPSRAACAGTGKNAGPMWGTSRRRSRPSERARGRPILSASRPRSSTPGSCDRRRPSAPSP